VARRVLKSPVSIVSDSKPQQTVDSTVVEVQVMGNCTNIG